MVEHLGALLPARVVTRLGVNSYMSILNWCGGPGKLRFSLDGVKSWWKESTRGSAKIRVGDREDVYQYTAAAGRDGRMTLSVLDHERKTVQVEEGYEATVILAPFVDCGGCPQGGETVDTDKYFRVPHMSVEPAKYACR